MDKDWHELVSQPQYEVMLEEDIRVESLTDKQMKDLNRLKGWLLSKRTQARIDRERTERDSK